MNLFSVTGSNHRANDSNELLSELLLIFNLTKFIRIRPKIILAVHIVLKFKILVTFYTENR